MTSEYEYLSAEEHGAIMARKQQDCSTRQTYARIHKPICHQPNGSTTVPSPRVIAATSRG